MEGLSFSNSLSKGSVYESDSIFGAYQHDAESRLADGVRPVAISNEEIHKGDDIIQTYRVEDDAIHGGMGSVWRVRHMGWNTDLAMKRPQPRFFAEGSEQRKADFVAECEHWINLGLHPNIVSCYYVRDISGVPTIFSEWMDGGSLKDAIQSGRLYEGTEEEVQARILDIAIQAARGLQYSHEQGLIHQDVKPGNILLTKDWDAKVADFGLAKAQSQLSDGEKPESSGYTLAYCPREQAEGAAAEPWMDVYAWALTVIEMYAGKRLWETGAEAAEHLTGYLDSVALPEGLVSLVKRCLNRREGFVGLEEPLREIYTGVAGVAYFRLEPIAALDTADSLNNRALSFIDLGMPEVAERLWEDALSRDDGHVDTIFNRAMHLWMSGRGTDIDLLNDIARIPDTKARDRVGALAAQARRELSEGGDHDENCNDRIRGRAVWLNSDEARYCPDPTGGGYIWSQKNSFNPSEERTYIYRIYPDGESLICMGQCPKLYEDVCESSVSQDGQYIVLFNENALSLYRVGNGSVVFSKGFSGTKSEMTSILCVCAGVDGGKCYIGGLHGIREFDLQTSDERVIYSGSGIYAIRRTCGGTMLLFRENATSMKLLDLRNGMIVASVETGERPSWFDLTIDGKALITGEGSALMRYDLESGEGTRVFAFSDAKARVCDLRGDRAITYTHDYLSLWDLKRGICLRSVRFQGIKGARLVEDCDGGMIRGFTWTNFPATFNTFVIASEAPEPTWALGRIRRTATQLMQDSAFREAIERAEDAVKRQDWIAARELLAEARNITNRKNDPACQRLYDAIHPHFGRGGLAQCIPVRNLAEWSRFQGGVSFSDDGAFLLVGSKAGKEVYFIRTGEKLLTLTSSECTVFTRGGTRVTHLRFEKEKGYGRREGVFEYYELRGGDVKGGRKPETALLVSHPLKYGLNPTVVEYDGKVFITSGGIIGTRLDLTVDADSGSVVKNALKPWSYERDALWKAAYKAGMRFASYMRMELGDGVTAFCYRIWEKEGKKKVWKHYLAFLDARAKLLKKVELEELGLMGAEPLAGGLLEAKQNDEKRLFKVEDFLDGKTPEGYVLPGEKVFRGLSLGVGSEGYKASKGFHWGVKTSPDGRYMFIDGRIYRLEWDLV